MARMRSLKGRLRRAQFGMRRQLRLYKKTGRPGYLREFRKWKLRAKSLRADIGKLRKRLEGPKIIAAAEIGVFPTGIFGPLGSIYWVTGHYTAGPVDTSDAHAIALCQAYDSQHRSQGWGGIGYHYCIARSGTIICLRPIGQKGAHTANANTGNAGIMMHGTTGDKPSAAQERSLHWLLKNAHTSKVPAAHRSPKPLDGVTRRGHKDWPGQATACPGEFHDMYLRGGSAK